MINKIQEIKERIQKEIDFIESKQEAEIKLVCEYQKEENADYSTINYHSGKVSAYRDCAYLLRFLLIDIS